MKDVNYYRRINGTYGTKNKREVNIKKTQKVLFKNILEHPNCQEVKFNNETESDYAIIVTDKDENKILIRQPDKKIKRGDLVNWGSDEWLCLSVDKDETMYSKGVIKECNKNLKFINENNDLITKPAITSAQTLYTTGVKDEKVIQIPDGMQGIQFPYDKDTKILKRGVFFIFNDAKYQITFLDRTTHPGLLILICKEFSIGNNDDRTNEIADRWVNVSGGGRIDRLPELDNQELSEEPIEPELPVEGISYTLAIETPYQSDDPDELWYEETYNYIVTKFINNIEVEGNFTFALSSDEYATITETTDTSCKVTAKDIFMGGSVTLTITDTKTSEIAIEKVITIKGM